MKCQYCGSNLDLDDAICPYCGRENHLADQYVNAINEVKEEQEEARKKAGILSRINTKRARIIVIVLELVAIVVMFTISEKYSDVEYRADASDHSTVVLTLNHLFSACAFNISKEMERSREYLAMDYYILNYRLRGEETYDDYFRVSTAAINYEVIYADILNIVTGNNYYGEKSKEDWCNDIAIYIAGWKQYVDGEFWGDTPDSPMHAGEHQGFMDDARKEIQDMVQVYFELTDEQAESMWNMEEAAVGTMLYEKCRELYPEVSGDE